jgi:peptidoglycan/xylan/chitin deacetylase (PgdA/CDA1 family)
MAHDPPYRYWSLPGRPALTYPGGATMAAYLAVNLEHFEPGRPATSRTPVTAALPVDPLNHGWRDYGNRIGFWRLLDVIDEHDLPVSVLLNSDAAQRYPELVEAGVQRGWAFLGHGRTNSELWTGFDRDDERRRLQHIVDVLAAATGRRPMGWLGPALTETEHTTDLLAELGFGYTLDWVADDQPFPLEPATGRLISVPYSIEVNDIPAFVDQGLTAAQFADLIVDQFEVLRAEAADRPGAVYTVSVHPFLVGQPFRHKHFAAAMRHVVGHADVWYANTDEIARWYYDTAYDQAVESLRDYRRKWDDR